MGRLISRRYLIEGMLEADTPIHIGGAAGDLVTDMALARDGAGNFYIPGTSLAGPIRRWWRRDREQRELVFGRVPNRNESEHEGHASYLVVDDAPAVETSPDIDEPAFEMRDGVGIDRETGGAVEAIKFDREVLPIGTRFNFRMEIDIYTGKASVVPENSKPNMPVPPDERKTKASLGALILALEAGNIHFGAAKTRGLGRLKLKGTRVREQSIGRKEGLLQRLRGIDPQSAADIRGELIDIAGTAFTPTVADPGEISIVVTWQPQLPVMSKSSSEGLAIDTLPLVAAVEDRLKPVITGASIKGVLRTHSERICRTLLRVKPPDRRPGKDELRPKREFFRDLDECELVEALFGSRADNGDGEQDRPETLDDVPVQGLGALCVDDCVIGAEITREQWRDLLSAAGDPDLKTVAVRESLDKHAWRDFRPVTHVAIDRWTGGAAPNLLFSRLEPALDGTWAFRLSLDVGRIAQWDADDQGNRRSVVRRPLDLPDFRKAAFGLLLVTLRELAEGRVPIGHGGTRGLGSISVQSIAFTMSPRTAQAVGVNVDGLPAKPGRDAVTLEIVPQSFNDPNSAEMQCFTEVETAWHKCWPDARSASND